MSYLTVDDLLLASNKQLATPRVARSVDLVAEMKCVLVCSSFLSSTLNVLL